MSRIFLANVPLSDARIIKLTAIGVAAASIVAIVLMVIPRADAAQAHEQMCGGIAATVVAVQGRPTLGTPGDDVIVGTSGPDVIRAGSGDDVICGRGGRDRLAGGAGDDTIFGGAGRDVLRGGPDDDRLRGGRHADQLRGGAGNDVLAGGRGRDLCVGGRGADGIMRCRQVTAKALVVSVAGPFVSLQDALDVVEPGQRIVLADVGPTTGPVTSRRAGAAGTPIEITAVPGAYLDCGSPEDGEIGRCFELQHPYYLFNEFAIVGGSSNLYMVGPEQGAYVHDVTVTNSIFRGAPNGGTGECIRIKYQAYDIEISHNDIADCGLGKCCDDSKSGEGIYIGTAPEQLEDKNPSPEPDRTNNIWVHHNTIRSLNECVEAKEAAHDIVVEHNSCAGQADPESGGFGSRGGRTGEGNTFRFNLIENTLGACIRFGGDNDPDGTGNNFYANTCTDIYGEHGIKQQREPQGLICANTFTGHLPTSRLSRTDTTDPTAPCPPNTPQTTDPHGAGRPNTAPPNWN